MINGLSRIRAKKLLKTHGFNVLEEPKQKPFIYLLFEQLNNILTILLLVAAVLSFFIGETIDGTLIISIIAINALFGLFQEHKASQAVVALRQLTVTKIRVLRDQQEVEIDSRYVVPGDVMFIEEGIKIPADAQIRQSINLEVNESALTGESLSVEKTANDDIYMGTIVSKGRGYATITATGMQTKFGQIAKNLSSIEEGKSPLQLKIEHLTKIIGLAGVGLSIVVFLLASFEGSSYFAAFLLAISLAVAVVPEGLPAVMTITLSIGMKEMARKKAIIRRLTAIEALGSVTLIATDKTGTLTTNKMKVKEVFIDNQKHLQLQALSPNHSTYQLLLLNGVLCSTASLSSQKDKSSFDILGDPTEGALLLAAVDKKLQPDLIRDQWKLVEEIPFDSVTKQMTVKVSKKNQHFTFCKGAPESILKLVTHLQVGETEVPLTKKHLSTIHQTLNEWASTGLRVLAFSYKKTHSGTTGQTFLGMVAIYDAPRPEIKQAVMQARTAGIRTVIITGDNEKTAAAVAQDAAIMSPTDQVITGSQLDELTDKQLIKILPQVTVFARTTPQHKYRIVKLYQSLGEIVAVTGDGVNDAIALKQADVGVAMGKVGTDVARETADMVITDDNFATIISAIEEGRNIIKNLKNAIIYLLSCNFTEALSLIIGMAVGLPHIFYPIQLLYINLVTDGIPALALAFSPRHQQVMNRPPQRHLSLLQRPEIIYIVSVGVFATILVLWSFSRWSQVAAFSVLALIQSFIFVDVWLSHRQPIIHLFHLRSPIFALAFTIPFIAQAAIVHISPLASLFKITPISFSLFALFIGTSFLILPLLWIFRPLLKRPT